MAILISSDGRPIECWEVGGYAWFAVSEWSREESDEYVRHGKYPQRLCDKIRQDYDTDSWDFPK